MTKEIDKTVSFDNEQLILVNPNDKIIGYQNKKKCHEGEGILHRAFSIFIFNSTGQILMQKRSKKKHLWPLFWSNSCCSHPRKGESYQIAIHRRLKEELGIESELKFLFKFQYQASFNNIGSENELCSVYIGKSDSQITINKNEIAAWKFFKISSLDEGLHKNLIKFTPWFKMEWERIRRDYWSVIQNM